VLGRMLAPVRTERRRYWFAPNPITEKKRLSLLLSTMAVWWGDMLLPHHTWCSELECGSLSLPRPRIAQALFVGRKTVEMHLGNAYRKLDIGSRGELSDALGESRPVA
jgi:hypothetical protein